MFRIDGKEFGGLETITPFFFGKIMASQSCDKFLFLSFSPLQIQILWASVCAGF